MHFTALSGRYSVFVRPLYETNVTYYSLPSDSMARAKADINAPLTQFQPVVQGNQAEQKDVLFTLPLMADHLRNAAILLRKTGR